MNESVDGGGRDYRTEINYVVSHEWEDDDFHLRHHIVITNTIAVRHEMVPIIVDLGQREFTVEAIAELTGAAEHVVKLILLSVMPEEAVGAPVDKHPPPLKLVHSDKSKPEKEKKNE